MDIATIDSNSYNITSTKPDTANVKPVLHFGVISRYPPRKIFKGYQPIMDYLSASTPYEFRLKLSNSYEETIQQLVNNDVQLAFLGTYIFLISYQQYGLECILKPFSETGEPNFHGTIITHKDSGIEQPKALFGKTFALTSQQSFTANSIRGFLQREGIKPSSIQSFRHHTTVLQKVLQGEYDAGAVRNIVAEKYVDRGLRIIYRSQPFPSGPIAVSKYCNPKIIQVVKSALMRINANKQKYQNLVKNWDSEFRNGFAEAHVEDYRQAHLQLE